MAKSKIHSWASMVTEREALRNSGDTLVFTNGCFDILHPGHVRYLKEARALGDRLVVAVNTDETVAVLKGEGRPLLPLKERMEILASLEVVDHVMSFEEETPKALIDILLPDILVKGGDWSTDSIVGAETVESYGGRVLALPFAPGYSTSTLIERIIQRLGKEK